MIIKRRKSKHWKNGWPAADVRVTPTTEQNNYQWKITKEEVKQDEKKFS